MKSIEKQVKNKELSSKNADISLKNKDAKSKKFLVVLDGLKFSETTLNYAIQLTKETDALLTGVFLDDVIYRSYDVVRVITSTKNSEELLKELDAKDKAKRDLSVKQFEKICTQAKIQYAVHRNKGIALQELKEVYTELEKHM